MEQEQAGLDMNDLGGNKVNENENEGENENKKSNEYIEDPRFDNIKGKLGKEIVDSLMSKKWESKKHGYELINNFLESNELSDVNSNDLFDYIRFKLKNFKETNFNVNREAINVFNTLVIKKLINKENLLSVILGYHEKITDQKSRNDHDLLDTYYFPPHSNKILRFLFQKI